MVTDPVVYINARRAKKEGFNDGPGWYFYDESWAYAHGPYASERACREQLRLYCEGL